MAFYARIAQQITDPEILKYIFFKLSIMNKYDKLTIVLFNNNIKGDNYDICNFLGGSFLKVLKNYLLKHFGSYMD